MLWRFVIFLTFALSWCIVEPKLNKEEYGEKLRFKLCRI